MISIKGRCNTAKIFTDKVENEAIMQIKTMCNSQVFKGCKIRIMPDVHSGAGCTIGTTMTIKDKIVPFMVGVDIGCGMYVVELKDKEIDYDMLDKYIRNNIPSGMKVRKAPHKYTQNIHIEELVCAKNVNIEKGYNSIGTLGGGNHFIEVDKDEDENLYLVVHTGSRHIGLEVAEHYQKAAINYHSSENVQIKRIKAIAGAEHKSKQEVQKILNGYEKQEPFFNQYLEKKLYNDYLHDMKIMQEYAEWNRRAIADDIIDGMGLVVKNRFTTVHNYIDIDNMIMRKGAVSAKRGERLLIPINMRDGSLLCIGKGREDWNYSAPHGAGRVMSRQKAMETLSLDKYRQQMSGIYTTCVSIKTLDESPMAYKSIDEVIHNIAPSVNIKKRLYPLYNYKAEEGPNDKWRKNKNKNKKEK